MFLTQYVSIKSLEKYDYDYVVKMFSKISKTPKVLVQKSEFQFQLNDGEDSQLNYLQLNNPLILRQTHHFIRLIQWIHMIHSIWISQILTNRLWCDYKVSKQITYGQKKKHIVTLQDKNSFGYKHSWFHFHYIFCQHIKTKELKYSLSDYCVPYQTTI